MRKMRSGVLLFIVIGIIGIIRLSAAEILPDACSDYKDPFMAGMLSFAMPGSGQIYARAYTRGSLFVLAELVNKSALVFLAVYLNDRYGQKGAETYGWNHLDLRDRGLVAGYFILSSAFTLYNSLDAIFAARRYNLRLEPLQPADSLPSSSGLAPSLRPLDAGGFAFGAVWRRSF